MPTEPTPTKAWSVNMDCPACGCNIRMQATRPGAGKLLRGRTLREAIIEVAAGFDEPFHYREAFERLDGVVDARDPVASFLTQLSRLPGVIRVGAGTYTYREGEDASNG